MNAGDRRDRGGKVCHKGARSVPQRHGPERGASSLREAKGQSVGMEMTVRDRSYA